MEFANDLMDALLNRARPGGASGFTAGSGAGLGHIFDWPSLHARLVAAHAVRQELAHGDSRPIMLGGRFFDWPVSGCDGAVLTRGVNLNDSTDGKGLHGMGADTAGQVHVGGRGQ